MRQLSRKLRRTSAMLSLAGAVLMSGMVSPAAALNVAVGDLVVGIFGNAQEHFRVLGNVNDLTTGPTHVFNVSDGLAAAGGTNAVQYSLFAVMDGLGGLATSSSKPLADFSQNQLQNSNLFASFGAISDFQGIVSPQVNGSDRATLAASDGFSFTSQFGPTGSYGGGIPVPQQGSVDQLLTLIHSQAGVGYISDMGQALLTANGQLQIGPQVAPIPLPPAVWLFGTGLISLVGLARRSMTKNPSVQ